MDNGPLVPTKIEVSKDNRYLLVHVTLRIPIKEFVDRKVKPINIALTMRQKQVLELLAKHQGNKQIAHELGIGVRTAKFHVSGLLKKFNVQGREQLLEAFVAEELQHQGEKEQ